ncbi:RNAse_P Rpr2/Rpp21/SNM1 subunit domain-containing protein [Hexamita inflata]|uniref:RNAse P Rpr2/Rpp21/SNM1 subunit domain-containing protein n=1 Tax=Hexamita inflata TaxID=28002 RepID=A0AA86NZS3_9EUKA|nr:RNAse P Rpr2/Rpp21/SNM1 subunit domain-containing protein [Hexamita inflata]
MSKAKVKKAPKTRIASKRVVELQANIPQYEILLHLDQLHKLALLFPENSQYYNKQIVELSQNAQVRLDPSVKHTFCKKCYNGIHKQLRIIQNKLQYQCDKCNHCQIIKSIQNLQ